MDLSYLVSTVQAGDSVMVWGKCTWHLDLNPLENLSNVLDGSAAAVWRYHVNINQNRWAFVPWIIKTVLSDMMVLEVYIQMNYGLGLAADSHLGRTVKFNEALNSSNHFSYSKNQNVTKKCFWHGNIALLLCYSDKDTYSGPYYAPAPQQLPCYFCIHHCPLSIMNTD